MAFRTIAWATAAAAFALPAAASAAVLAIGSSSARMCFEAAEAQTIPVPADLGRCDSALNDDNLSMHDIVATHVNRGIVRLRRNQNALAIADFDEAMRLDPQQPEAYLNKGVALLRQNDNAPALQLFSVALERNTQRPEFAYYGRAVANEALGNLRAAYDDYRQASRHNPRWREPQIELTRFRIVER